MAAAVDVIAAVVIARINPVRDKWEGCAPARPGVAEAFCLRPTASAVGTGQEDSVCRRLEGRGRFLFDEKDKFI